MRKITLSIGEHFYLDINQGAYYIVKGTLEIYITTKEHTERTFLSKCAEGELALNLKDDLEQVDLLFFAKSDVELEFYTKEELDQLRQEQPELLDVAAARKGLHAWFKKFLEQGSFSFIDIDNDENLIHWRTGELFYNVPAEELWQVAKQHQQILYTLCSAQINRNRSYFSERLQKRYEKKARLSDASVNVLLGRMSNDTAQALVKGDVSGLAKLVYIAMDKLGMAVVELSMSKQVADSLDELSQLKFFLRKGGLRFRRLLLNNDWYIQDNSFIFVKYDESIALACPKDIDKYVLYTQDGQSLELTDEVAARIEPTALQVYAGLPTCALTVKDLYSFIFRQCWKLDYLNILLTSVVLGIIPLLTPIITDTVFSDVIPIYDYRGLSTITQVMLVSGFTTAGLTVVRSLGVMRVTSHMDISADAALWSRLLALPADFFKKYSVGELYERVSSFAYVKQVVTGEFISGIFNAVFSIWSLLLMFYYSWKLTCLAMVCWLLYFLATWIIYRNVTQLQRESIKTKNENTSQVIQIFNGLSKFRSRGGEEQAFFLWSKCFSKKWNANLKLRQQNNYGVVLNSVLPMVLSIVLYWFNADLLKEQAKEALTVTKFMSFNAAYTSFNVALVAMVPLFIQYFSISPHIENLKPILETVPEVMDDKPDAPQLNGEIELHHISFAYPNGPEILHNISLRIKPKEKVAIVGPSGCGKSTLMRIILGFERPSKGIITYDGMDLAEININSVRRQLGVVLQSGSLLSGSILDNIIGSNNLTIDEAWEAARKVALDKDIEEMPMGMHTVINDTANNISGGQRQRILLARSIVNNPVVLLLDEATSALDNSTQSIVTDSLEKMNCTQVLVAHRLSTIRNVDRIIVMKDGDIVEQGSFDQLMAKGGLFSDLAKRQLV